MVETLQTILFPDTGESTYAVIDGASCEDLLGKFGEFQPEHVCLYAGENPPDVREAAPYLVRLDAADGFTDWLLSTGWGKHWGIFAVGDADLQTLRKHFRSFLLVRNSAGKKLYFRYYDPRVLNIYLPTTNAAERQTVFGPLSTYVTETKGGGGIIYRYHQGELDQRTFPAEAAAGSKR